MPYTDCGKDYEEKYHKYLRGDDPEYVLPCFSESCTDELLQARVEARISDALENTGMHFGERISIFGQYLADMYHVVPEDIEYMCQLVISEVFRLTGPLAQEIAVCLTDPYQAIKGKINPKRNIIAFPKDSDQK